MPALEWDECPSCRKQLTWKFRQYNCVGSCPCGQHIEIEFDDCGPDEEGDMDEFWTLWAITEEELEERKKSGLLEFVEIKYDDQ